MTVRRLPLVLIIVALVLGAYVAGDADPEAVAVSDSPNEAIARPPEGTTSSAWYCAGAPSGVPVEAEVLHVANLGDVATTVNVTVRPDDPAISPAPQSIEVPSHSVANPDRAALGPAGAVVVESFSRDIVVEAGVQSDTQLAIGPCATTTSEHWYFAAGTTLRGVQQWLVLFNPLGTDAKVDVNLHTDEEVEAVPLRAISVPRRSRVLVSIDNNGQRRRQRVAVEVISRSGRVVAEQSLVYTDGTANFVTPGITRSVGVVEPALTWTFAHGRSSTAGPTFIAIHNTEIVVADVEVTAIPVGGDPIVHEVAVPGGGVTWVEIGTCGEGAQPDCLPIEVDHSYSLTVDSLRDAPIVAEQLVRFGDAEVAAGVATVQGVSRGATTWAFARSRVRDERSAALALATVGPAVAPALVDVSLVRDGRVELVPELTGIEVPPGAPTIVSLAESLSHAGALLVTSSSPIVATRTLSATSDFTIATGVPSD